MAQDGTVVRAALTTSWSNAQAAGHVSRLKTLNRILHSRASFALRRRHVLIAA